MLPSSLIVLMKMVFLKMVLATGFIFPFGAYSLFPCTFSTTSLSLEFDVEAFLVHEITDAPIDYYQTRDRELHIGAESWSICWTLLHKTVSFPWTVPLIYGWF